MTDQTESPWRTLAERLGCLPKNHRPGDAVLILLGNRWTPPSDGDAQDLLIGRALRVAWAWSIENGKTQEFIMAVDMVTQSNPKLLATHCLKLLDTVGYTND
jgi:hypothetical protein